MSNPFQVKEDLYKCYPQAKLGHLKTGGNFPFLSRSDEFNLFITVSQVISSFLKGFKSSRSQLPDVRDPQSA
jgi:hypothetical protein